MLFRVQSIWELWVLLFWNGIALAVFHLTLLAVCIRLPQQWLQPERRRFRPWSWEQDGRFYRQHLHIQLWKDRVPQYVARGGFSKEQLAEHCSLPYVEAFLRETCRGEWYHAAALWVIPAVLVLDAPLYGIGISAGMLLVHSPCIAIQRYNRFRLEILRRRLKRLQKS